MANRGTRLIPENPIFATESERVIWESLKDSLSDGDVLIHGLRFTDRQAGDVEIDILLLSPEKGAAVIEVKGGHVEYVNGEWILSNGNGSRRRIHPTDQARRAKHALRKYLDRHPEWNHGLLRSQWFLALPRTDVQGDLGPEAPKEVVIGSQDITAARSMIDESLSKALREPQVPPEGWVDQAVSMLLDAPEASVSDARFTAAQKASSHGLHEGLTIAGIVLGSIAVAGLFVTIAGLWGLLPAAVVVSAVLALGFTVFKSAMPRRLAIVVSSAVGAVFVGGLGVWVTTEFLFPEGSPTNPGTLSVARAMEERGISASDLECHSAYSPCVLQTEWDRNCSDIGFKVFLTGTDDPYGLDRDRNGVGCQTYPESLAGERPAS